VSGDPEQEYFADGMVEEIITALSRIRWLFVIARNSTFTCKGRAIDVKQVGHELGVRYVLQGSVRKGGKRVRISAQLIDALNGTHLWADRFDGLVEDIFDLQDKVASSVGGVLEPALQAAETAHSASRPTNDLTAYDLICAPMRWPFRRQRKSPRRSISSSRRSGAIRVTRRRSPGPRSAVDGCRAPSARAQAASTRSAP
jgi:TolB-like protein